MILGLLLALASALATNRAFLLKHRGAVLAPPIRVRHPLGSAAGLFRSRSFLIGWIVAVVAWGLHVGALALAPLSIVQAVLSGGPVFLAVLAERFFGFELGRRQWVGVTITAAGLVVIGLTSGGAEDTQRASLAALIAIEGAIFAVVAALIRVSTRRHLPQRGEGLLLCATTGELLGEQTVPARRQGLGGAAQVGAWPGRRTGVGDGGLPTRLGLAGALLNRARRAGVAGAQQARGMPRWMGGGSAAAAQRTG